MLKSGRRRFATALVAISSLVAAMTIAGVRINTSYSLPLGIYVTACDVNARLVEFCPVEPFGSESRARGYRTRGTACPDGAVPLLKHVVAIAGDRVVVSAEGINVNGRLLPNTAPLFSDAVGRDLYPWPFGVYVVEKDTVWVASTYNRGSYDSPLHGTNQSLADPFEASPTMAPLTSCRILGSGLIGFVAWHGEMWATSLSVIAPCLIAAQPHRVSATAAAFAYYAAAWWPVLAISKIYWPSSGIQAVLFWLAAAAILSSPWLFCWTSRSALRPWTTVVAIALTAVPPLCIVGWASPLIAAGVLFPKTAWAGVAAVLALPGLLLSERPRVVTAITVTAASFVLNAHVEPLSAPNGWEGETTRIHRQPKSDYLADFIVDEQLQQTALSSRARFLVFPEGAVRRWTDATDAFWVATLSGSQKTLLMGAGQPVPGSSRYTNSVVIVGEYPRHAVHQRIPVPGGMWNPFRPQSGFGLNLFGAGIVEVGGERAAILICYEQLLTWPMLRSAIARPTLLIAISNEVWTAATSVPRVQRACVRAWARLFGLPVISAINS